MAYLDKRIPRMPETTDTGYGKPSTFSDIYVWVLGWIRCGYSDHLSDASDCTARVQGLSVDSKETADQPVKN